MQGASKIKFYIKINTYVLRVLFSINKFFLKYSLEILYISKLKFIN